MGGKQDAKDVKHGMTT